LIFKSCVTSASHLELLKFLSTVFLYTRIYIYSNKTANHHASWERNLKLYRCPMDNKLKVCPLTETSWYQIYIENPDVDSDRFQKKIRRSFRMCYSSFRRRMEEVKQSYFFKAWTTGSRDTVGNASTPIDLLVLGVPYFLHSCLCNSSNKFIHVFWDAKWKIDEVRFFSRLNEIGVLFFVFTVPHGERERTCEFRSRSTVWKGLSRTICCM